MRHVHSFWFLLVLSAIAAIVLVSLLHKDSAGEAPIAKVDNFLLGTLVEIQAWDGELDDAGLRRAIQQAFYEIRKVESEMSVNIDGSAIQKINESAGQAPTAVSPSVIFVLDRAMRVSELSGGAFDVTIGAVYRLWDFTSDNSARPPHPDAIARNLKYVDYSRVEVSATSSTVCLHDSGMRLDPGGLAKGYAIDLATKALSDAGVRNFIVNAGGDMFVSGRRPNGERWRIGVRHPRLAGELMCILQVTNWAVVTSGDYERFFEFDGKRFHHILDPGTGYPAAGCQSVTVIAKEATVADALATAVFVMGPEHGLQLIDRLKNVEAQIVGADGEHFHSKGFGHFLPGGSPNSP